MGFGAPREDNGFADFLVNATLHASGPLRAVYSRWRRRQCIVLSSDGGFTADRSAAGWARWTAEGLQAYDSVECTGRCLDSLAAEIEAMYRGTEALVSEVLAAMGREL